jgi:hypothetical protein
MVKTWSFQGAVSADIEWGQGELTAGVVEEREPDTIGRSRQAANSGMG